MSVVEWQPLSGVFLWQGVLIEKGVRQGQQFENGSGVRWLVVVPVLTSWKPVVHFERAKVLAVHHRPNVPDRLAL